MIDRKCLNRLQLSMYCISFVTLRASECGLSVGCILIWIKT